MAYMHVHAYCMYMHVGACALGGTGMILSFSDCFFFFGDYKIFVDWMLS